MTTKPGARDLRRRFGEVPPVETDERRAWLLALTADELRVITRAHGQTVDDPFADCWGWGATASGLMEGDPIPRCVKCNRETKHPLWFTDGFEVWARCWSCAAVDHLTLCDLWDLARAD
jgi:hypothetical protein